MKKTLTVTILLLSSLICFADDIKVAGPDGKLQVQLTINNGSPAYSVSYNGKPILENSPLGLYTNVGDFSKGMSFVSKKENKIEENYQLNRIKKSSVQYRANELICTFANSNKQEIDIVFRVSNNDIAFRYALPQFAKAKCIVIEKEATGFDFPQQTTTFMCPQAKPMSGWERSKPSYEEEYTPDEPIGTPSRFGVGYTFPCLFRVGENGWALVSETGVTGNYCGSRLSEGTKEGLYTVAFPQEGENNGFGSTSASMALPAETPWRTITVGDNLKPIVETTVPFDVVKQIYEPSQKYSFGRSTWSWILWQDASANYNDQKAFIDLAATMGYEFILIDALWDTNIGYDRMSELIKYAKSKNVDVFLWYNSNGSWNDAPQGPKHKMNNPIARKQEMKWLKANGVKGIKVDFFGGDKQETMKLYEEILSDANEYGVMCIFHGCTLPRGWERMYPNFVGSEAVLASENLIFSQHHNDVEAFNACLHPFIRNAVGSMEFGPVLLNERRNRENNGGNKRIVTETLELATSILFQNPVQNFGIAPNNLTDKPAFEIDFMKKIPTTWDETLFIDGYPGKYCILARKHNNQWYIAGANATKETLKLKINLPMLSGSTVSHYFDDKNRTAQKGELKIGKTGEVTIQMVSDGGFILTSL